MNTLIRKHRVFVGQNYDVYFPIEILERVMGYKESYGIGTGERGVAYNLHPYQLLVRLFH